MRNYHSLSAWRTKKIRCARLSLCILGLAAGCSTHIEKANSQMILSAKINQPRTIDVRLQEGVKPVAASEFSLTPKTAITRMETKEGFVRLHTEALDLSVTHYLHFHGGKKEVQPDAILNRFISRKALGCTWDEQQTWFRLFSPRASRVTLSIYADAETPRDVQHEMSRDGDGVWEVTLPGHYFGQFYVYRVDGPRSSTEQFDYDKPICDPYARAVATRNEYLHRGRTLILDTGRYDWEGDQPLGYQWPDLIIYECHVRDLTAHPSSGCPAELAGSYKGLIQPGLPGGIDYIRSLGVNAVELLPIHEFGNIEIPYNVDAGGVTNTWNPYSRNHWGYMTSYFFAPESYYASGATMTPGSLSGADGRQVDELKDVIKAFHKAGIAVILDVVYNHVSQYDQNCFKLADKKYYFHLDDDQNYIATSGCGNDFKTERPMAQRMILESVKYWMEEYHVDGFRFDLAAMIDGQTIDLITAEARRINPNVILIAEPWGGGKYNPAEFSQHDWAAWNDQFRNSIKGQNPENGQGFIFGRYWGSDTRETIKRYIRGNLAKEGGLFQSTRHAVNYLGSHDDHAYGDFVRIGNGDVGIFQTIQDPLSNARLTTQQLKINKLGALILFTSQGAVMFEEGNEFARSKLIARTQEPDPHQGQIDHNSYNKDNETNWLDYGHAKINEELVDYYRGLIALRKNFPALRQTPAQQIQFSDGSNALALSFQIGQKGTDLLVLINAHHEESAEFDLPQGNWHVLVNGDKAGAAPQFRLMEREIILPPTTGMVLMK